MTLNKDENIENTKSEGEAKGEDEQYGKPNQQCQKHEKVIADQTKTKEQEKLHQETLQNSQKNKQKEITLEKNDDRERNIGETKPQKITEDGERDMHGM